VLQLFPYGNPDRPCDHPHDGLSPFSGTNDFFSFSFPFPLFFPPPSPRVSFAERAIFRSIPVRAMGAIFAQLGGSRELSPFFFFPSPPPPPPPFPFPFVTTEKLGFLLLIVRQHFPQCREPLGKNILSRSIRSDEYLIHRIGEDSPPPPPPPSFLSSPFSSRFAFWVWGALFLLLFLDPVLEDKSEFNFSRLSSLLCQRRRNGFFFPPPLLLFFFLRIKPKS